MITWCDNCLFCKFNASTKRCNLLPVNDFQKSNKYSKVVRVNIVNMFILFSLRRINGVNQLAVYQKRKMLNEMFGNFTTINFITYDKINKFHFTLE